jgi:hypothetical protein
LSSWRSGSLERRMEGMLGESVSSNGALTKMMGTHAGSPAIVTKTGVAAIVTYSHYWAAI